MRLNKPPGVTLKDFQAIEKIFHAAGAVVTDEIEDFIGPLSVEQQYQVVGVMVGFYFANLDHFHGRADGESWKDIFEKALPILEQQDE